MSQFTKETRQAIIDDFIYRHGSYEPRVFVEEVAEKCGEHPAYKWFMWDNDAAATEYRVWQARMFVRDLVVKFSVETIIHGKITVRHVEAPYIFSSTEDRNSGGGYERVDPTNPESMAKFCHEAAVAMRQWIDRYEGALVYAGGTTKPLIAVMRILEAAWKPDADATE